MAASSSSSSMEENNNSGSSSATNKPIRLVYCDENGKFKAHPDGIDALAQVKGPVAVVCVYGSDRQGNSFILNQLLGSSTAGLQLPPINQPQAKGLWMWSVPLKRTALDGTEYNLLLLDGEVIDAHDQTGMYSTQVFTLAILLSSIFVYNQIGGMGKAAAEHLSLFSKITKHIGTVSSEGKDMPSWIRQFSPLVVWLLRDMCPDLVEGYTKITLSPVPIGEKDIAVKNEIQSIQALFPDQECFMLSGPLDNETEHLHQVLFDTFMPDCQSEFEGFTNFVYERSRPKQFGGSSPTGPILASFTKSFLDTVNNGEIPTLSSSCQSVEELECQKAFNTATGVYLSAFDHTMPSEEEHERNSFQEAHLQCSNAVSGMEKKLIAACQVGDANIDSVLLVLDNLLSEYEASLYGPAKWQRLFSFLKQSLHGPIIHLVKKLIEEVLSKNHALELKCSTAESEIQLLLKQLKAGEKLKIEYQKCYEGAINDLKQLSNHHISRTTDLGSKCSLLDKRLSSVLEMLDSSKQETLEWKRKYEQILSKINAIDQDNAKKLVPDSGRHEGEARVVAAYEPVRLALKEAHEWKEKYEIAVKDAKTAMEKASMIEKFFEEAKLQEEALRTKFSNKLVEKDEEIKEKLAKLEEAEQRITKLKLDLEAAEKKTQSYDSEQTALKLQVKELTNTNESIKAAAQAFEREAQRLRDDRIQLEHNYLSELVKSEEAYEKCKVAEQKIKVVNEHLETTQLKAQIAHDEKSEAQQLASERLSQIESLKQHIKVLEEQKLDLTVDIEKSRASEVYATSKVALLEAMVKERDQEILKMKDERRPNSDDEFLESCFQYEHPTHAEINSKGLTAPTQLESLEGNLNILKQNLYSGHSDESALHSGIKTFSRAKRSRLGISSGGFNTVGVEIGEEVQMETHIPNMSMAPLQKCSRTEVVDHGLKVNEEASVDQKVDSVDYRKLTVAKLRQELIQQGFGADLCELKTPRKKDIIALYEKLILRK